MRSLQRIATAALTAQLAAQGAPNFERSVLPILEQSCIKCHKAPYEDSRGIRRKPKADLRLDGKAWILKGSKDNVVLIPGNAQKSLLWSLTTLPDGHRDLMPYKGDRLTRAQQDTLRNWIDAGADFGTWLGAAGPRTNTRRKPRKKVAVLSKLAAGLERPGKLAIDKARGDFARIEPAHPGSPLLRVEFVSNEHHADDAAVARLAKVARNVTHLGLARTKVTDEALAVIARMPRLTHLDLRDTAVTDAGLRHLSRLRELRCLNLFGTAVSDRGVATLARLEKLEAVYLAGSRVTVEGVRELRQALPAARILHTPELPKPERPNPNRRRRRRR